MQSGNSKTMSFGRMNAKVLVAKDIKARFSDVQGIEEAKEELVELVFFKTHVCACIAQAPYISHHQSKRCCKANYKYYKRRKHTYKTLLYF